MKYKPLAAVWEITMGCNMRCKHCGSACKNALPEELTTEESLKLCKDLGKLGLKWVTVSGGEALLRKDWHLIAKGLKDNGVTPLLITNGWIVNKEIVKQAEDSGIESFAMSLDGTKETHDFMRMKGSFDRIMNAYNLIEGTKLVKAAITTINKKNIKELDKIKKILIDKKVKLWQVQVGLPMGNFAENDEIALEPSDIDKVIDFAYETIPDERITIYLADCLGYYNWKEIAVRDKTYKSKNVMWKGCSAGKESFGILHNGDILGCTSIRDRQFVEGNIRNQSLKEIWENENNFSWSRGLSKEKLSGFCSKCGFGDKCLGGCPNTRLTFRKSIYAENDYCSYNMAIKKASKILDKIDSPEKLFNIGKKFIDKKEYQLAEIVLKKAIELDSNNIEFLNHYGFVCYMLKNYNDAKIANDTVLNKQENNIYANKGMGLTLVKLGQIKEGLKFLKKAVDLTDSDYMLPYHDLALTFIELGKIDDAIKIIEKGKTLSESFKTMAKDLCDIIDEKRREELTAIK